MERGSSYKATRFAMKGYSYPGKSPVKVKNYFTPDLFTTHVSDVSDKTKKQIEEDKQWIQKTSDKYPSKTKPYVDHDPGGAEDKTKPSKLTPEQRQANLELMMAISNPLGFAIGKGLTRLFGGKSRKEEIAKKGKDLEKKDKKNKKEFIKNEDIASTENPDDKKTDEGGNEIVAS